MAETPEMQQSQDRSISASKMVTKNQFIEQLQPIQCSICLDDYSSEHVPVELSCGHIFGDHCIVEQTETKTANNNRCPLCRQELFEQEDFTSTGGAPSDSDEPLIEFDDHDDSTDEEERDTEEEQHRRTFTALLHAELALHSHLADSNLGMTTSRSGRRRQSAIALEAADTTASRMDRHVEFREHTARRREMSRTSAPKQPRRTRTYSQIESLDVETDADWSGSEYELEEDIDSTDEREEKRAYRLLPGEYDTTLPIQPSASS